MNYTNVILSLTFVLFLGASSVLSGEVDWDAINDALTPTHIQLSVTPNASLETTAGYQLNCTAVKLEKEGKITGPYNVWFKRDGKQIAVFTLNGTVVNRSNEVNFAAKVDYVSKGPVVSYPTYTITLTKPANGGNLTGSYYCQFHYEYANGVKNWFSTTWNTTSNQFSSTSPGWSDNFS